jgi:hypothetical protein
MSDENRTATQPPLFVESLADAVHALAMMCGGWKGLACQLKPELAEDPEKAGRWLSDALNDDRREVLHADHLIRALKIGRAADCHVLKHWLDESTEYEKSQPAESKPPMTLLSERLQRLTDEISRTTQEMERVQAADALKVIDLRRAAE